VQTDVEGTNHYPAVVQFLPYALGHLVERTSGSSEGNRVGFTCSIHGILRIGEDHESLRRHAGDGRIHYWISEFAGRK
jgi:hypothetical protein